MAGKALVKAVGMETEVFICGEKEVGEEGEKYR